MKSKRKSVEQAVMYPDFGCTREMTSRKVSRLPSLKTPVNCSPASHSPSSLSPSNGRSRQPSLSSNENGSLTRDVHLTDFSFVEQLEDFRHQLLDLRREKKKLEDEIIKYKLLCKEKHQGIQELHNKLEAEKANTYDLKEQLSRDITLQLSNQHASDKKKMSFDISILKNDKRKMESQIRLLETTNKGLFEEIRQIRSSYDAKMEKLMKDFHIEIYKESGEKRRLAKKLAHTNDKLTKEEYLARQAELEKERAEEEAKGIKSRKTSTFGAETGTLDRQNKKIAELEETIRKLESLKTIAESQNMDLIRKLKEAERGNKGGTLKRRGEESKDTTPVTAVSRGGSTLKRKSEETRDSPAAIDKKRTVNKVTGKDKVEAAEKRINKDGIASSKKDLESFLRLANKERNVLERKIALLEKTRQATTDVKIDNEISTLREQHRGLLHNISDKDKKLSELEDDSDHDSHVRSNDLPGQHDSHVRSNDLPGPSSVVDTPKKTLGRKSMKTRRINRTPSPNPKGKVGEEGSTPKRGESFSRGGDTRACDQRGGKKKADRGPGDGTLKRSKKSSQDRSKKKEDEDGVSSSIVKIDRSNYTGREQQTMTVVKIDQEIQVEFFEEEIGEMYDPFGGGGDGGKFLFQEEEPSNNTSDLGVVHAHDNMFEDYEEKLAALQTLREKDMEKISSLGEIIEQYKQEVSALNRKAGSYYNELEANSSKLNTSVAEIDKLNEEIKSLQKLNNSIVEPDTDSLGAEVEKELTESKKEVMHLTSDIREKQLTIMKLHQELHEASEQVMDKSGMVRQLEALVDNLKQDKDIMREEQMTFESTTEEVLDQLRTQKVRNNQLEELVKSLELDSDTHKSDVIKFTEERDKLQSDKERLEVENEELVNKMVARDIELESALSENPDSENNQATLKLLQEIKQKDSVMKRLQQKHQDTLQSLKKEVDKQVNQLQSKVSRRDDDLANLKSQHESERNELINKINEMEAENTSLRDTVVEREQEIEESFNTVTNDNSSIEFKELNKRLGELANENMRLRDEMNNYKNILSSNDKDEVGFIREITDMKWRQHPNFNSQKPPIITVTDDMIDTEVDEEEEEEEDIGEISVALVVYSYDPHTMSPNDYPEDELSLDSGDFIYIFGDPDEDGFYTAEHMSGERGLVPRNFIQTVDLNEKKTQQMRRVSQTQRLSALLPKIPCLNTSSNRDIPIPERVECEEIASDDILLTWELPISGVPILGFKVLVNNHEFRVTNTAECRTMLSSLPSPRPLYLTVRSLTSTGQGRDSIPCIFGRDPIKAPQSLEVTNITSSSAVVAFVGQPHYFHAVLLNSRHTVSLTPGEFVYMLRGLEAGSLYEVQIVTLSSDSSADLDQSAYSLYTTFSTKTSDTKEPSSSPTSTPWKPLSPPLETRPSAPNNLQLSILDRERLCVSWEGVDNCLRYEVYLNEVLVQPPTSHTSLILSISQLRVQEDEQRFHVVAVGSHLVGDCSHSLPSETISFSRSALLPQLSFSGDTVSVGLVSPPPSDTSESEQDSALPNQIRSRVLVRVVSPPPSTHFLVGQILSVEEDTPTGYRTTSHGHAGHVTHHVLPATCVTKVRIIQRVVALYDYHPDTMSPNVDSSEELSFRAGDVILVYGQETGGFLKGVLDTQEGLVPPNFVLDLEAVLSLRTLDETAQQPSLMEMPSNLMTVNSS